MNARRLILAALTMLCAAIGGLAFAGAALAVEPPAKIDGESFSEVGSAGVAVSARVDTLGTNSSYYYEYGTTEAYGSTTPTANLGAVNGDVGAPGELSGLQPDTIYHFRAVVTNELGTVYGADVEFRTLAVGLQGLPDGRVYEMVTPVDNHNADLYFPEAQGSFVQPGSGGAETSLPFQAAASGDAVTYVAEATSGGRGGANQYLATRSPSGGWTQVNIQPDLYSTPSYQGFSSDLSVGVLESSDSGLPPLAPGAPGEGYRVLYTRSGDGPYHALVTANPPNRTPLEFKTGGSGAPGVEQRLEYAGGSSGFGHVLFAANDALTPEAMTSPPASSENDLYDSVGGRLYLVNVLPDGTVALGAAFGASIPSFTDPVLSHVISSDGSRVFWTDGKTGDLYVRENDSQPESPLSGSGRCMVPADACTVQVDASQNPGVTGGGGSFWTASSDGSRVFFTDESRLTEDSTAAAGQPDLYELDVESGVLIDLSIDGNAGEHANVLGVVGAGEDGEYVYFVATGNLAAGASAVEPNLYVAHGGVVKLVTSLAYTDDKIQGDAGSYGVWQHSPSLRTAEVAPDGRSLVFSTEYKRRFGFTNVELGGNVYLYNVESGHLVCASCSPSVDVASVGERPVTGAAGGYLPVDPSNFMYQPRLISEDGSRVFFLSEHALAARDVNGAQDVYEWERDGSGSCRESPGCVYLISSGTSSSSSGLVDASASGDDVFVITRSQLVPEDGDETFNVFDARVGGAQPLAAAACSGAGCQGIPSAPPVFATPSSQTYNGIGNFSASAGPAVAPKLKAKANSGRKAKRKHKAKRGRKRHGAKAHDGKARGAGHGDGVGDMERSGR